MCVHVRVCVCVYVCIYIYIYIDISIYISISISISISIYIYIYIYSNVCDGRNHLFFPLLAQFQKNYLGMFAVKSRLGHDVVSCSELQ